ncbi:MAG: hypothetical protein ACLFTK_02835 [Anaerolineales bacterium]
MWNMTKPLTKRHIGVLLIALGLLAGIGALLYDVIGFGAPDGGFGPSQQIGLLGAVGLCVLGASLWPLGDTLA